MRIIFWLIKKDSLTSYGPLHLYSIVPKTTCIECVISRVCHDNTLINCQTLYTTLTRWVRLYLNAPMLRDTTAKLLWRKINNFTIYIFIFSNRNPFQWKTKTILYSSNIIYHLRYEPLFILIHNTLPSSIQMTLPALSGQVMIERLPLNLA